MKKKSLLPIFILLFSSFIDDMFAQCPHTLNSYNMGTLNITTTSQQTAAYNGDFYIMSLAVGDTVIIQSLTYYIEITLWDASKAILTSSNTGDLQVIISQAGIYYVHFSDASCSEDGTLLDNFTYQVFPQTVGGTVPVQLSLGQGTFVEGVTNVNNNISVNNADVPNGSVSATFMLLDSTGQAAIAGTVQTDNYSADGWGVNIDMGNASPNCYAYVEFLDNANAVIDYGYVQLDITPKPDWLISGGTAIANSISGNIINISGIYPINSITQTIPTTVKAIGGKNLDLSNCRLTLDIDYNFNTKASSINSSDAILELNTLDLVTLSKTINFNQGSLNLNALFNLSASIKDSITVAKYQANFPGLKFPVCPGVDVKVDAGVSFYADLKGQIVLGSSSGQFGFYDNGTDKTKFTARLQAGGFVRGSVKVLYGAASATARLDITGRLGIGFEYVSIPSSQLTPLFGGDVDISGTVELETFWGFGPNKTFGPTSFYYNSFGNLAAVNKTIGESFNETFGSRSITYNMNGTMSIPSNHPMPSFGSNDNELYTVWVENDASNNGYLLLSKLDSNGSCFSQEILIAVNKNSISNPKVAVMPSGSALVTWSQNRYNSNNLPFNIPTDVLFNSQDVWGAIYDNTSNSVVANFRLADDTSSVSSGRGEGEANISMGTSNEGLITWITKDLGQNESSLLFSHIVENAGNWTLTIPAIIGGVSPVGINKDVKIAYRSNIEAYAVWINDPDGLDSTDNNLIYTSTWDGNTWTTPSVLVPNPTNDISFNELSLAANSDHCIVAFTCSYFTSSNNLVNQVNAIVWDQVDQLWDTSKELLDYDTTIYIQKPRASINQNGLASISYQVVEMYPDTNYIDPGEIYLYLNNFSNTSAQWVAINGNQFVSDPSTYVWAMDAGFGNNDVLYSITQEYNETTGPVSSPSNGVLFGDPQLSMVFRAISVDANLNVYNFTEPNCIPTGFNKEEIKNRKDFDILQNFPNPVSDFTLIEYTIKKEGRAIIEITDLYGKPVMTLIDKQLTPGIYQTRFIPENLSAGAYFYSLTVNGQKTTKKMIITK